MPLGDISAECEIHESRTEDGHARVDRLGSSDKGEGDAGTQAQAKAAQVKPQSPRTNPRLIMGAVLIVAAVVVVAVLVMWVIDQERSPIDVYREYVDASNDRDIRRMFDQTVTKFTDDYDDRLANLSQDVFRLDPEIEIVNLGATYEGNLSPAHVLAAEVIADDIESRLDVKVDEYCYVGYTVNVNYRDIDQIATFSGEVLCVKIDGGWLLAIPGFY